MELFSKCTSKYKQGAVHEEGCVPEMCLNEVWKWTTFLCVAMQFLRILPPQNCISHHIPPQKHLAKFVEATCWALNKRPKMHLGKVWVVFEERTPQK
jgi:hypothetical protein